VFTMVYFTAQTRGRFSD